MFRGKNYKESAKLVDRTVQYDPREAFDLLTKTAKAKFDETVELHVKLGVDSRHADQQVRGAIVLPHGTGKTRKVLVFCKEERIQECLNAGADYAGGQELAQKIQTENWFDFDVAIASPDMMSVVGRLGRVLGPKGLMPTPKAGTVTPNLAQAIAEVKAGKIEYRLDKTNIIHCPIGRVSFGADKLMENAAYYQRAGGGVTFTGGEPLMQAAFVLETLSLLPDGIHTAVETSGYGSKDAFKGFMAAFDLIMLDLKSMDDAVHRRYTGVSNAGILDNAALLCAGSTPFIIRIPLIPGVNDNDAHYQSVAALISGAPALIGVELLPYHKTAGAKYAMAGKVYEPDFDTDRPLYINQDLFSRYGIRSRVL